MRIMETDFVADGDRIQKGYIVILLGWVEKREWNDCTIGPSFKFFVCSRGQICYWNSGSETSLEEAPWIFKYRTKKLL